MTNGGEIVEKFGSQIQNFGHLRDRQTHAYTISCMYCMYVCMCVLPRSPHTYQYISRACIRIHAYAYFEKTNSKIHFHATHERLSCISVPRYIYKMFLSFLIKQFPTFSKERYIYMHTSTIHAYVRTHMHTCSKSKSTKSI